MSRLLKITDNGNGILVQGTDNILYPDNATLTFPYNSIILVTDESDIATFRSASNNDVLFSGLIGKIEIGSTTVTKANIIEKFDEIANQENGGGEPFVPSDYYTKSETNTLLEGKADVSDIPTYLSELTNDVGYITQSEVIINESFPVDWLSAQSMTDLIQAINDDSDAMVGKVYMDTISLSDLPAGMMQAEVKAEIMSELEPGGDKVILFTVTSSNTSPYHWEYTSAYGATGTWREWLVSSDIANFFDGAEYDSTTKRINFKHGNTVKTYIDATAFIKDGMVDTVVISNGNLVITFNTDAGKEAITIPLTDIFDPSNYYTKTATDTLLNAKADASSLATVATSGSYNDLSNKPTIPVVPTNVSAFTNDAGYLTQHQSLANYYTKSEVDDEIDLALVDYVDKATFDEKEEVISTALNDLNDNKQDTLTAGTNITIQNNVISASGAAAQIQSDWAQNDSNSVDFIKNKPDLSVYAQSSSLSTVATSGDYDDLLNKPTIPTVPTNVSAFTNDAVYVVSSSLSTVATSGDYDDLLNKPTIPTVPTNVSAFTNDAGYLTQHQSLTEYYTKTQSDTKYLDKATFDVKEEVISTALNALDTNKQDTLTAGTNITIQNNVISATGGTQVQSDWNETDTSDPSYIQNKPTIPDVSEYVEKSVYNQKEIAIANALTDLNENKADKTDVPNMTNYYTKTQTDTAISTAVGQIDLSGYMTTSAFDVKEETISAALNVLDERIGDIDTILQSI